MPKLTPKKNKTNLQRALVQAIFGFEWPASLNRSIVLDHVNLSAIQAAAEEALERHADETVRNLFVGPGKRRPDKSDILRELLREVLDCMFEHVQIKSWCDKGACQHEDFVGTFEDDPEEAVDLDDRKWAFECHIEAALSSADDEEKYVFKVKAEVSHDFEINQEAKTVSATNFSSSVAIQETFSAEFGKPLMETVYHAFIDWTVTHPGCNYVLDKIDDMFCQPPKEK